MSGFTGMPTASRYGFEGAICGFNFTDQNAAVVCRQRGFGGGYALRAVTTSTDTLPYVLSGLRCNGSEPTIDQCQRAPFVNASTDCSLGTSAHVLCTTT